MNSVHATIFFVWFSFLVNVMNAENLQSMICLGIESTAHTFSVGVVDFEGNVRSVCNNTYIPDSGGLHPQKVVEHHYACFEETIQIALKEANLTFKDINLIAFSQGPGIGAVLRIGAAIARALSLKLKIPLIGVNHCIAHVEIGRNHSGFKDPLTLYVSGGNTIVSAFETGKYQIFGETLDISIGNLLDMFARFMDLPHPGGPKLEKMALQGKTYISMPYVVKGMDLSFSGLYTHAKTHLEQIKQKQSNHSVEDLVYSLQETAFSMLAEVTERAIAHTEKKEVLLTGGVAANKRLQEMIRLISEEHGAKFSTVPLKLAGDNGAMIAWTGIIEYLSTQTHATFNIDKTQINAKWRMDTVEIPWRSNEQAQNLTDIKNKENIREEIRIPNTIYKGLVVRKGAEAYLIESEWWSKKVMIKYRIPKKYRIKEIDQMLRKQRTALEAKALIDVKDFGFPTPIVYEVDLDNALIIMEYIEGLRIKDMMQSSEKRLLEELFRKIGEFMGHLHKNDRIHGDLTTSNIMITKENKIYFIDFGLSQTNASIEDKAVDLHLFKRVMTSTHGSQFYLYDMFIEGYRASKTPKCEEIIALVSDIDLRGRYVEKSKRKNAAQ